MICSDSRSVQLLENFTGHLMPHLHPPQSMGLPSDVLSNPKRQKSSNGQIWQNWEKSEYFGEMGVMGLSSIVLVHALILFSGVAGLNLRSWVENRHVGPFGELGRAHRTTQRFT
ncbi:hypothetical protein H5410_026418 [Solanum commersonii]|uniref:Uncharacterized protein n=1 Tax=Solanum commersonii TaxID=4109 RepID=A0A9J5Z1G6_SOLCO|nr:hypothetical protein H5410_026418 [Solanum commersonii]